MPGIFGRNLCLCKLKFNLIHAKLRLDLLDNLFACGYYKSLHFGAYYCFKRKNPILKISCIVFPTQFWKPCSFFSFLLGYRLTLNFVKFHTYVSTDKMFKIRLRLRILWMKSVIGVERVCECVHKVIVSAYIESSNRKLLYHLLPIIVTVIDPIHW